MTTIMSVAPCSDVDALTPALSRSARWRDLESLSVVQAPGGSRREWQAVELVSGGGKLLLVGSRALLVPHGLGALCAQVSADLMSCDRARALHALRQLRAVAPESSLAGMRWAACMTDPNAEDDGAPPGRRGRT